MNALAMSLQTYFTTFARTQRDLSANTIASYRDTRRMLLKYQADLPSTQRPANPKGHGGTRSRIEQPGPPSAPRSHSTPTRLS